MRASAFRSTCQAACCRPRTTTAQPARLSRAVRQQQQQQQQRRSYASGQEGQQKEHRQMDTPNKSGNLPLLIGGAALLVGGATYTISKGQSDNIKHNDHAAQAGGEFTHGREQQGSTASAHDQSKADLPGDAPNKPEYLAVSEEKMQTKPPSKKTDPQV